MVIQLKISSADMMSVTEAAELLGVTRMTIHRWVKSGKLPAMELIGFDQRGVLFIRRADLEPLRT